MGMEEGERKAVLRFRTRMSKKLGRPVEIAYFYSIYDVKDFHARCERGVISSFLERVDAERYVTIEHKGKSIYLIGESLNVSSLFMRLVILAACRHCIKDDGKIYDAAGVVAGLGEVEALFWYSRIIGEYDRGEGFKGICRVVKAFQVLYKIK